MKYKIKNKEMIENKHINLYSTLFIFINTYLCKVLHVYIEHITILIESITILMVSLFHLLIFHKISFLLQIIYTLLNQQE